MSKRKHYFAVIAVTVLCFHAAHAQVKSGNPVIPGILWETHAGVVNFAVTLTTMGEKDEQKNAIRMYIKNISTSVQDLVWSSDSDQGTGFYIFTIDGNGIKHLMHDRAPVHKQGESQLEYARVEAQIMVSHSGSASLIEIAPGDTLSRMIVLSSTDLALVKSRPVQCHFTIINPKTTQEYAVNSSPKMLIEVVSK